MRVGDGEHRTLKTWSPHVEYIIDPHSHRYPASSTSLAINPVKRSTMPPPRCWCKGEFKTKEAMASHLQSTSLPHPTCVRCNKKFSSSAGLDDVSTSSEGSLIAVNPRRVGATCTDDRSIVAAFQHMEKKHPKMYKCELCQREFKQEFALEDHYKGSPQHPNCAACGKGFKTKTLHDLVSFFLVYRG